MSVSERQHGTRRPGRGTALVVSAALVALTWGIYAPAADYGLLGYDDPFYVTECPLVTRGLERHSVASAWTTTYFSNYHPLTTLSWAAEVELFGLDPRIFHRTNIGLHAANAVLLFLALRSLTGATWRPAVAAALFAAHPLCVQPVCWVSSRKDVLSFFFATGAILSYGVWARRRSWWAYGATFAALTASLLSKQVFATLPCVLLLLDFWPLGRWRPFGTAAERTDATGAGHAEGPTSAGGADRGTAAPRPLRSLLIEKIPLLVPAVVLFGAIAGMQLRNSAPPPEVDTSLSGRIVRAATNYVAYAADAVLPVRLSPMHPATEAHSRAHAAACIAGMLAVAGLALALARRVPEAVVGWLWFVGVLVPTVGFLPLGENVRADRYMYAPLPGLLIAGTWLAARVARACRVPAGLSAAGACVAVLLLAFEARTETGTWADDRALVAKALAADPDSPLALYQSGRLLASEERWDEAVAAYRRSIEVAPEKIDAYLGIGTIELHRGRPEESLRIHERAAEVAPGHFGVRMGLCRALQALGRHDEAEALLDRLLEEMPELRAVRTAAGLVELERRDRPEAAIGHFRAAFAVNPHDERTKRLLAEAHARLGRKLLDAGNAEEAVKHFTQVLMLVPDDLAAQQGHAEAQARLAAGSSPAP
jgi:tetratricopeptide (TPR) repeat protein